MRRPLHAVGASVAAAFVLAAFTLWSVPAQAAVKCGPDPGHTADAKVILKDTSYQPAAVTLTAAGQSVCWEHQDGSRGHTITSDAAPGAPDHFRFPIGTTCATEGDSGCFKQGDQPWKLELKSSGNYPYHCEVHPNMKGVITVQGSPATTRPPATTTTRPGTTATTAGGTTGTTVGTLSTATTATTLTLGSTTSSSSSSTTSSSTTSTTSDDAAIDINEDDDDDPNRVLQAVGVVLLLAVIAALIPAWRQLT